MPSTSTVLSCIILFNPFQVDQTSKEQQEQKPYDFLRVGKTKPPDMHAHRTSQDIIYKLCKFAGLSAVEKCVIFQYNLYLMVKTIYKISFSVCLRYYFVVENPILTAIFFFPGQECQDYICAFNVHVVQICLIGRYPLSK
jgi:hypothetical protein